MKSDYTYLLLLVYATPLVSALLSIGFLHLVPARWVEGVNTTLRRLITLYFSVVAVNWALNLVREFSGPLLFAFKVPSYSLLLVVQVILYHTLYVLTSESGQHPFRRWHYALPVILLVVFQAWALLLPDTIPAVDRAVSAAFPIVRFTYSLAYSLLSLQCILRYRRIAVDFTANPDKSSLDWLLAVLLVSFPMLFTPVVIYCFIPTPAVLSPWGILPALFMSVQLPVLCYYFIHQQYIIIPPDDPEESAPTEPRTLHNITRDELEHFMATHKPYLQPDLKITDLTVPLKTNRSYLSKFINANYDMNFSQYINEYRLRELAALLAHPESAEADNLDLIYLAGFGSYHSYYRVKKESDKRKTLKRDGVPPKYTDLNEV